ncbi:MAG: hypothetical protein ACD_23C00226G0009, partial [uncultured bacterium]
MKLLRNLKFSMGAAVIAGLAACGGGGGDSASSSG